MKHRWWLNYEINVSAQSDEFKHGYSLGYQRGKAKKYEEYEIVVAALNRMLDRYQRVAKTWRERAIAR